MNDTTVKRILIQLELLVELSMDDLAPLGVSAPEVCAFAEGFLLDLPDDDAAWAWPADNFRGEQNSYLDRILSRVLHGLGRQMQEAKKEAVPQGAKWTGDVPPGPGKIPGVNS